MMKMLEQGHEKVKLSKEETDKLACWIDLGVPYCGDYAEGNIWTCNSNGPTRHIENRHGSVIKLALQ